MYKKLYLTSLIACLFSLAANSQQVEKGFVDLSGLQLSAEKPTYLYGEWEFYWQQLLEPEDFKLSRTPTYGRVPAAWNRKEYSALGYATYRLRARLAEDRPALSIFFPVFCSAAKIWVNGKMAATVGKVGTDPSHYDAQLKGALISLPSSGTELEIIIQIANFSYFYGGIPRAPQLDTPEAHHLRISRTNGIENFFAGSLVAMFIYQLILYFLYDRGKPYLWLSMICLGVALRAMIIHGGSFLLPNLFPYVSWEIWKKIEFGAVYAIVAIFPLYVYHLFKDQAPRWPLNVLVGISLLLCGAVIVTPQYVYGQLLEISHLGLILGFLYAVYSITKAWRAGNRDARIILLGVLASFPFILMEIMKNSPFIRAYVPFHYLVELGVLVFLVFQVYLLASHYAISYSQLEHMNRSLEKIIEERTGELYTANKVKDRLLSVMSHDVKSPLNSLRGLLQVYNSGAISKQEFDKFSQHIEDDLSKTTILVENILYWTASQIKGVEVKKELFDINAMVREVSQLFRTIAAHKKINILVYDVSETATVYSDKNILYLVLRNLVSNAIKFSHPDDQVKIISTMAKGKLRIDVVDEGIGMDEEMVETVKGDIDYSESTLGTSNEKGTGLGLALCKEYLEKIDGTLEASSVKGKGSTFTIIVNRALEVSPLAE